MAIRPLDDDDDTAVTNATLRSQRMNAAGLNANPELAKRIGANAAVARGLNGGAALALAKGGVGPDSPVMAKVARAAAKNKAKKGLGWHSFGEAVSAVGRTAGDVVEEVGDVAATGAKGITRIGTVALSAPLEEVQGLYRAGYKTIADGGSFGSNLSKAGGSTARLALGDLMDGKKVRLGTGLFAGHKEGELGAEQQRLARRLKVNGQWISVGRSIATVVSEPGTKPYQIMSGLVDGAIAIAGDPAALGLGKLAKLQKAKKAFLAQDAGMLTGRRPMLLEEVTDQWLTGPVGSKVINYGAETTDAAEIWRTFGRKVPVSLVRDISKATSPDEVRDLIKSSVLEGKLRNKPTLEVRRSFDNVRMLQTMPGRAVDPNDADAVVRQMENFMRNAKLPEDTIKARLNSIIERSGEDNRVAMFDEVNATMGDTFVGVKAALDGKTDGAQTVARRLTKMWGNYTDTLAKYYTDDIGNNAPVLGAVLDGNDLPLPTPHLVSEYIGGAIPLPDARAIRRVTSQYGRLMDKPGLDWGVAALDFLSNDVWKPMVLLRGAWTIRVVGEEQIRMASAGLDSVFRHPISAISYIAGSPNSRLGKMLDAIPGVDPRAATGIGQRAFDESVEEFQSALSVRGGGWRDRVTVLGKRPVRRDEPDFAKFWSHELLKLENDPIGRRVLRGLEPGDGVAAPRAGLDGVKDWFWEGTGSKFRKELGSGPRREAILTDRQVADDYIDTVFKRWQVKTADDPELMEFMRSGPLRGEGREASPRLMAKLEELNAAGRAPSTVVGDIEWNMRQSQGAKASAGVDKAVDALFNALMSKPTNTLSRSPAFKQFYWKRVEEMIGQADEAGRAAILADAKAANLSRKQIARLEAKQAAGDLNPDQIDLMAKGFAVDSTKGLLYDLSQRSQFFDITRLLFPFGEAWKEILQTWSRVGFTEGGGKPFRRAQQTIEGARGAGFFYTDPQTGEEMFNYPGSGILNNALIGVPVPFQGRVGGLNLVGSSVLPGLGPIVQIPASKLIPNKPEWDWLQEIVVPFGEPNFKQGVLESQLPGWLQKLRTFNDDPESDRLFANTVTDLMRYLRSTGDYTNSEEDQDRLEADAISKARKLYVIRAGAQFFSPTSPKPVAIAKVPETAAAELRKAHPELFDGDRLFNPALATRTVMADLVLNDFREMSDRDYDTAPFAFMDKYGEGALLFMQPKSRSVVGGLPVSKVGNDWVRTHPDIVKRYPLIYGYFAPQGDPGDFDIAAYNRQLESGEREPLSPHEVLRLASSRVGAMLYDQAKLKAGTTRAGQEWLSTVRTAIAAEYPGFGEKLGLAERAKFPQVLEQLEEAATDEKVLETDAGKGLVLYLAARQKALGQLAAISTKGRPIKGIGSAKAARPIREWLRQVAAAIGEEHPDFAPLFEQSLSREFTADDRAEEL